MVRLKVELKWRIKYEEEEFQFQNGAIKSSVGDEVQARFILFQFQNGAIKSPEALFFDDVKTVFQFQNGAIKSCRRLCGKRKRFFSFNSKMVRLKGCWLVCG